MSDGQDTPGPPPLRDLSAASQPQGEAGARPQFWYYLWVLRRRLWLMILLPCACVAIAFMRLVERPAQYSATVRLLIGEDVGAQRLSRQQVPLMATVNGDRDLETQILVIQSRAVAEAVVEALNLTKRREFIAPPRPARPLWRTRVAQWLKEVVPTSKESAEAKNSDKSAEVAEISKRQAVRMLLSRLQVTPVRRTRLVDVSFSGYDRQLVADVANAIAEAYIQRETKRGMATIEQVMLYLGEQQAKFQEKVEKAEKGLLEYKRQANLIALESREDVQENKLAALTAALSEARIARIRAESHYNALKDVVAGENQGTALGKFSDMPKIADLARDYLRTKGEMERLSKVYGPKHPRMIELAGKVEESQALLQTEVRAAVDGAKAKLEMAQSEEKGLQQALDEQKKEVLELERKMIQYNVMKRDADSSEKLFNVLLEQAKEISLVGQHAQRAVEIFAKAEVPRYPMPAQRNRSVAAAMVLGLVIAIAIAFFLDYMDHSIKSVDDLEACLNLSVIGRVSGISDKEKGDQVEGMPVVLASPASLVADAFRSLRTNLVFALRASGSRSLVITSTGPEEGKTTVASNLASALAQSGKEVLLVDADLRRPAVHRAFGIRPEIGLTDYLVGEADLDQIVVKPVADGPSVIPCGRIPPNPSELLGSDTMASFFQWANENYDFVVFDAPPAATVSDALVLAGLVGTVLFVVRTGTASRTIAMRTVRQIQALSVQVPGAVLNDVDRIDRSQYGRYGYSYYRKYHRYHKEGSGDEDKSKQRTEKDKSRSNP